MTVKSRLLFSLAIPVVLLALISVIAIRSLSSINASVASIYDDRVVPLKQLKLIADAYAVFVIDAVNKGNAGVFT
ncbi:MAG TPA: MCP four helix bundle domain-containing protein, partial [Permianibacter sp.]|nr:MCP four helix bundle domain-containing protein [Permianibacter sp.]